MVNTYDSKPGLIVGSFASFTSGLIDIANHLVKFDSWLPSGNIRSIPLAPTGNLLCEKAIYNRLNGFDERYMLSDVLFSWSAISAGIPIWFDPEACVKHHHDENIKEIVLERWSRGREFGYLRIKYNSASTGLMQLIGCLSILPLRLVKLTFRVMIHSIQAKMCIKFAMVSPLVVLGEAAWLAGEGAAYINLLRPKENNFN